MRFYTGLKMNKQADIPGWAYIIALIIGLCIILFAFWLFTRSGQGMVDLLRGFR